MKRILIIYHKSDFDGLLSCVVVKKYLLNNYDNIDVKCLGWTFGEEYLNTSQILGYYNKIYIVDLSFPVDMMKRFNESEKVIWIDHHSSAIELSEQEGYEDMKGLRGLNVAACELAWNYFYTPINCPTFIQIMSSFDVFDRNRFDWEEVTLPLQYGMRTEYGLDIDRIYQDIDTLMDAGMKQLIQNGKTILKFLFHQWESAVKNYGFEITVAGRYRGICLMTTQFESTQFRSVIKNYDFTAVVNRRNTGVYSLSLYKEPGVLPEFNNGLYLHSLSNNAGGHANAAGIQLTEEQFINFIQNKCI